MDVSVIVVSYNSASLVRGCLDSVRTQEGVGIELIVVDNASTDDTAGTVRGLSPEIRLIENHENAGFGKACNQGFDASSGRYIYLLNPDAALVSPNALSTLLRALGEHPHWGMAGTRILAPDGRPETPPARNYPGQFRAGNNFHRLPGEIAWIVGASMFIRRNVFQEIGGFDPDFFLYSEETDFCLRVRQRGHEIGFVQTVEVRHQGGASERGRGPFDVWTQRAMGMHLFWRKHFSAADAARLIRRDRVRAGYHMLLNRALAALLPPQSRAWQKYRRHKAIWRACSESLASK